MGCWRVNLVCPILSLARMRSLSQLDGHTSVKDLRLFSLLVPTASHSSFHLCFTLDCIIGYQSLKENFASDALRAAAVTSLSAFSRPRTPTWDEHQQKESSHGGPVYVANEPLCVLMGVWSHSVQLPAN